VAYLLDGNNLIGTERGGAAAEEDQAALVREVSDRLRRTRAQVVLFFDGGGRPLALGALSIKFAGAVSADEAILREVARSKRPEEATVVTADRALSRHARDAGARTLSPTEFWARFGRESRPAPARTPESPVDVDEWVRWFEDETNRKR
jgi:predicted RNA-binding protein with PIN domain